MRRLPLLIFALVALAAAPAAEAGSLALSGGRGTADVASRDGVIFGNIGAGRLTVIDGARARTVVRVWGAERVSKPNRRTAVYVNTRRGMGFSIVDGDWRAVMHGSGINASVAALGTAVLSGSAGTYRLNGGPARRWPRSARLIPLG